MTARSVLDVTTQETQTGNFHFLSLKELGVGGIGDEIAFLIENSFWRSLRFRRHIPAAAPVCLENNAAEVDPRSVYTDLVKVKPCHYDAAKTSEEENFNDRTIKSLTHEELHKLFPGPINDKLRQAIMDVMDPKKRVDTCLKKLKDSVEPNSLRAALSNNNVLDDYLNILRGMKKQMDHVQSFLEAHIDFLEEIRKEKPGESSNKEAEGSDMQTGASQASQSPASGSETWDTLPELVSGNEVDMTSEPSCPNPSGQQQQTQMPADPESLPNTEMHVTSGQPVPRSEQVKKEKKLTYQIVVGGKTFNAHQQLMDKLKEKVPLVEFDKTKQNHKITVLFCPISTRIGLDVKAAMDDIKDDKPIILVLMHHYPEPQFVSNRRTWEDYPNIVLFVSVFYHDSVHGLIKCEENDKAIHNIKEKLVEIYTKNNPKTSKTDEQTKKNTFVFPFISSKK